ncbi:MAG: hypothetical protein IIA85_00370 [Nanoarchaeota archaeon]|nr:hypothetical protein [Nanoarchaeota archaeon]
MALITCKNCGEEKYHEAKKLCRKCYLKISWKPKLVECLRCKRNLPMHAKGVCVGCYQFVFRSESNKAWNHRKYHNISSELYKEITKSCVLCGFDKVVDLHHLDENKKNNSKENLAGLCPNHHKMFHNFNYRKEVQEELRKKGFKVPEDIKIDFERRKLSDEDD